MLWIFNGLEWTITIIITLCILWPVFTSRQLKFKTIFFFIVVALISYIPLHIFVVIPDEKNMYLQNIIGEELLKRIPNKANLSFEDCIARVEVGTEKFKTLIEEFIGILAEKNAITQSPTYLLDQFHLMENALDHSITRYDDKLLYSETCSNITESQEVLPWLKQPLGIFQLEPLPILIVDQFIPIVEIKAANDTRIFAKTINYLIAIHLLKQHEPRNNLFISGKEMSLVYHQTSFKDIAKYVNELNSPNTIILESPIAIRILVDHLDTDNLRQPASCYEILEENDGLTLSDIDNPPFFSFKTNRNCLPQRLQQFFPSSVSPYSSEE